jgi:VanZ family protein
MKRSKFWLLTTCIILVGITVLSLLPPKSGLEIQSNDKVNHFVAYACLTFSGLATKILKREFGMVLFFILFGILMEWLQGFVPGRDQSFFDTVANILGVGIGFFIYRSLRRLSFMN